VALLGLAFALAWEGDTLWFSSRDTRRIYALNGPTWTVGWETESPGTPWGLTVVGKELRVVSGETAEDNRFIRRCVPGQGYDPSFGWACPDDCGSHLGYNGKQRVTRPQVRVPVAGDDQPRRWVRPRGEIREQLDRGAVGPVEVVEHEQRRASARGRVEHRCDRCEHAQSRAR